mmetsp:Transcript_42225/g.80729  ORF Transcript_42225/g.80729 Transcript_42225/m.80729 type:complete len:103 (+) Transcript_42225:421-729(+)
MLWLVKTILLSMKMQANGPYTTLWTLQSWRLLALNNVDAVDRTLRKMFSQYLKSCMLHVRFTKLPMSMVQITKFALCVLMPPLNMHLCRVDTNVCASLMLTS